MWPFIVLHLLVALTSPAERLLLLQDAPSPNLERTLVHQQLLQNLMRDPATHVVGNQMQPAHLRRAAALHEQADLAASDAQRHLHALNPQQAAISASAAIMRFERVAELTGDVTGLGCALALSAAAHLLLEQNPEAERALTRLLALDPHFIPSPALYNRSMQTSVRRLAEALEQRPKDAVQLQVADSTAAVFLDGTFAGFGALEVSVMRGIPHYLWIVPERGEPVGNKLMPQSADGAFASTVLLPLWPSNGAPRQEELFGSIVAMARLPSAEINPHQQALAARRIDTVLVLGYSAGALHLVTFDLKTGQRRSTKAAAAITDFWDVNRIADALLAAPPPLATLPDGA